MKRLTIAFCAAFISLVTPALAQDNPVVVELFTSQGCSSCPPADAILHEIAEREDVIALALHVDYWDYIGWKDPFGNPDHANRQRAYAAAGHRRTIYTPEMIVNGQTDIVGAKPMDLSKAIAEHSRMESKVSLEVKRNGDNVDISAKVTDRTPGAMVVQMLRYTPRQTTQIKRGENRGKTLSYANVVEDLRVLDNWDGKTPLRLSAKAAGNKPVVVIIQGRKSGPIFAAVRLK